jgi:protein-disulfide isomerase
VVTRVKEWEPLARTGQRMGATPARLTIVEFSDFQCPFCAQARLMLRAALETHPGVALAYHHFPLPGHAYAFDAAVAAGCAADQGRFEAYHDQLFSNQDSIGVTGWDAFASRAGVADVERFRTCLEEEPARARVNRDRSAGARLGLGGTPTFIVNGRMFSGSVPPGGWDRWIEDGLRGR